MTEEATFGTLERGNNVEENEERGEAREPKMAGGAGSTDADRLLDTAVPQMSSFYHRLNFDGEGNVFAGLTLCWVYGTEAFECRNYK